MTFPEQWPLATLKKIMSQFIIACLVLCVTSLFVNHLLAKESSPVSPPLPTLLSLRHFLLRRVYEWGAPLSYDCIEVENHFFVVIPIRALKRSQRGISIWGSCVSVCSLCFQSSERKKKNTMFNCVGKTYTAAEHV